jgi:hypothetical protein
MFNGLKAIGRGGAKISIVAPFGNLKPTSVAAHSQSL